MSPRIALFGCLTVALTIASGIMALALAYAVVVATMALLARPPP